MSSLNLELQGGHGSATDGPFSRQKAIWNGRADGQGKSGLRELIRNRWKIGISVSHLNNGRMEDWIPPVKVIVIGY